MSLRGSVDLFFSVAHSSKLWPLVASASLAVLVTALPWFIGIELQFLDATSYVNMAMVLLISGAAFALDDPALPGKVSLPVAPGKVALLRMALCLLVVIPAWVLQLWIAPKLVQSSAEFDPRGLFIQPFAMLAWVWIVAVIRTARSSDGGGGSAAAPFLLLVALVMTRLPEHLALFVSPDTPFYAASRQRWLAVLLLGVLTMAAVMGPRPRLGSAFVPGGRGLVRTLVRRRR